MVLDEIGAYLAANGIGTVGTDLFLGFLPDTPDAAVAIYETGGMEPYRAMRSSAGQPVAERPSIQVVCRNVAYEYQTARTTADSAWKLLEGLGDTTLAGVRYLWAAAVQSPFLMGRDDSGRVLIAFNVDLVKAMS